MSRALVKEHTASEERFASLFPDAKGKAHEAVGVCPRCGAPVYEGKRDSSVITGNALLPSGKTINSFPVRKIHYKICGGGSFERGPRFHVRALQRKTGKTYDAVVILDDTGDKYVNFKLEFPAKKGRRK